MFRYLSFLLFFCLACAQPTPVKSTKKVATVPTEYQRTIAVTIDDLPGVSLTNYKDVTGKLLTTLKNYKVPAIGFVNENKLYPKRKLDKSRLTLLDNWLEAGMELGNHTYRHPDYNKLTFEEFSADVLKGEILTKELQAKHGQKMQFFRHPFLHTGNTTEKKQQLEVFFKEQNYEIAPVTIDNAEWIIASAYIDALKAGDSTLMKKIGEAYIPYMEAKTVYFEDQCQQLFDREIKQILLIHANALNGDYLDELLEMYQKRGYQFISLAATLEDTAYQSKDEFVGRAGITWLHRWAITNKVDKSFFAGEPTCPEFIQKLTGFTE